MNIPRDVDQDKNFEDKGFKAFTSVVFDWTRQLQSVWQDGDYHVEALNKSVLDSIVYSDSPKFPENG